MSIVFVLYVGNCWHQHFTALILTDNKPDGYTLMGVWVLNVRKIKPSIPDSA